VSNGDPAGGSSDGGLVLELRGVSRQFGAVRALTNVTFDCRAGEVHALVGETFHFFYNGTHRTTLQITTYRWNDAKRTGAVTPLRDLHIRPLPRADPKPWRLGPIQKGGRTSPPDGHRSRIILPT